MGSGDLSLGMFFLTVYFILFVIFAVVAIFAAVCMWKMFVKAGHEGWKAIIPLYNLYTLFEIVTGNGWYCLIMLLSGIPYVGLFLMILLGYLIGKAYGKSKMFGLVACGVVPIIGYAVIAFGDAQYVGPQDVRTLFVSE